MADASLLIGEAFRKLAETPGFVERPDQRQLALLLSDCIADSSSGAFEAPTGLGKSLATLIPAIAHAYATGKRTVIATYTNVLAEQYWRNDLPLALSLFDDEIPLCQFLIGRQRYACMAAIKEQGSAGLNEFRLKALLGIETEFRQKVAKPARELAQLWQAVAAPPVCPARLCPFYHDCYYYNARKGAEKALIVITNHSVVIQDALLKKASNDELSMLGDYDFLVLDEAHDFPQAAMNGLEFELSEGKLGLLSGIALKMQLALQPISMEAGDPLMWNGLCDGYREKVEELQKRLKNYGAGIGAGILRAFPEDLSKHPQVLARTSQQGLVVAKTLAEEVGDLTLDFVRSAEEIVSAWRRDGAIAIPKADEAKEAMKNYAMYLREFGYGCQALFSPTYGPQSDVGVTYTSGYDDRTILRHDVIGLAEPLQELLWEKTPYACMSATLAVDGNFDFFRRMTGANPSFEEVLPSPFDFPSQTAIYMPRTGVIEDPTYARKVGREQEYYKQIAREVTQIIEAMDGRTLVLFHSRKEMEAVRMLVDLDPGEHPIVMQKAYGSAATGEKFRDNVRVSMFALRSFWTGFDAPGETLSCVVLVRVPFEVPIDPPQVARMAWLQTLGLDPFGSYSLPQAKMMMRQGVGRLIRRSEDRGVIALLDPRLKLKKYGEEILANLPEGIRVYDDIEEAVGAVGLDGAGALRI